MSNLSEKLRKAQQERERQDKEANQRAIQRQQQEEYAHRLAADQQKREEEERSQLLRRLDVRGLLRELQQYKRWRGEVKDVLGDYYYVYSGHDYRERRDVHVHGSVLIRKERTDYGISYRVIYVGFFYQYTSYVLGVGYSYSSRWEEAVARAADDAESVEFTEDPTDNNGIRETRENITDILVKMFG